VSGRPKEGAREDERMTDAAAPAFQGFGSKNYRAYVIGALLVVYTFNFIDLW
jgi:hypothetical protein